MQSADQDRARQNTECHAEDEPRQKTRFSWRGASSLAHNIIEWKSISSLNRSKLPVNPAHHRVHIVPFKLKVRFHGFILIIGKNLQLLPEHLLAVKSRCIFPELAHVSAIGNR